MVMPMQVYQPLQLIQNVPQPATAFFGSPQPMRIMQEERSPTIIAKLGNLGDPNRDKENHKEVSLKLFGEEALSNKENRQVR